MDWKFFSSINTEELENTLDFDVLQRILPYISSCDLSSEFKHVDLNIRKLFRLSQILINYLIYSQDQLFDKISHLTIQNDKLNIRLQNQHHKISSRKKTICQLRKELSPHQSKFYSECDISNRNAQIKYACMGCKKSFLSLEYLRSHYERRHSQESFCSILLYPCLWGEISNIVHQAPAVLSACKQGNACGNVLNPNEISRREQHTSQDEIFHDIIHNQVIERNSPMDTNPNKLVPEIQDHRINHVKSAIQEEIHRNMKEYFNQNDNIVHELEKQEHNTSELAKSIKICQELICEFKACNTTRSNLGDLEDDVNIAVLTTGYRDSYSQNQSEKFPLIVHREVSNFIEEKLTTELVNVQKELRREQNELLQITSMQFISGINADILATNEKLDILQSEISKIRSTEHNNLEYSICSEDCVTNDLPQILPNFRNSILVSNTKTEDMPLDCNAERVFEYSNKDRSDFDENTFSTINLSKQPLSKLDWEPQSEVYILINPATSISSQSTQIIKKYINFLLLKKFFSCHNKHPIKRLSESKLLSLLSVLQSSRNEYAMHFPNYFLSLRIALCNLQLLLRSVSNERELAICSEQYDNRVKVLTTSIASGMKHDVSVPTICPESLSKPLSSAVQILSNMNLEFDNQKLCRRQKPCATWEPEFSNCVSGTTDLFVEFRRSNETYSSKSNIINSNSCLDMHPKEFGKEGDCISSDFSLSDVTNDTDIPNDIQNID